MIETLTWNGLTFTVKPFTLDGMYSFMEGVSALSEGASKLRGMFELGCKVLLQGTTKEAQDQLDSDQLAKSVLTSEDVKEALKFKSRVDFFCVKFTKQSQELMQSAPDLTDKLTQKARSQSSRTSRKGSKAERAHSG